MVLPHSVSLVHREYDILMNNASPILFASMSSILTLVGTRNHYFWVLRRNLSPRYRQCCLKEDERMLFCILQQQSSFRNSRWFSFGPLIRARHPWYKNWVKAWCLSRSCRLEVVLFLVHSSFFALQLDVMLACLADEADIVDDIIGAGKHVSWRIQGTFFGLTLMSLLLGDISTH